MTVHERIRTGPGAGANHTHRPYVFKYWCFRGEGGRSLLEVQLDELVGHGGGREHAQVCKKQCDPLRAGVITASAKGGRVNAGSMSAKRSSLAPAQVHFAGALCNMRLPLKAFVRQ